MLFSADLVRELVDNRYQIIEDNQSRYADDVAIGSWIAKHISEETLDGIVTHIRSGESATRDNTFVSPRNISMINYVNTKIQDQRVVQNAYHYHFRADNIGQMVSFDSHFS